ncbi:MAG: 16S rRNA methyltransferase [Anaerolineae bacterium]|nr:16S rRNA methyltransferase [Anaerolineae bacterium]
MNADQLDRLVETILASPKYKHICRDFVRNIGVQELTKRRNLKEAVKVTKNKLHQVGGAYWPGKTDYAAWLAELREARAAGKADFLRACLRIQSHHTSTRERLPGLEKFYPTVLAGLPPIHSVIDLACGLNPLSIPWMSLPGQVEYFAYDIYRDMIEFLTQFMDLAGVNGRAEARDVIHACPTHSVDLALVLKAIPCLEQVNKAAGTRLLDTLQADYLLVSFPAHSLGGSRKGMAVSYEARFEEMMANRDWPMKRFAFAHELVFLVNKK